PYAVSVLFLLFRPRPRAPLFPYTTLFRSEGEAVGLVFLMAAVGEGHREHDQRRQLHQQQQERDRGDVGEPVEAEPCPEPTDHPPDRKSTRLNSSHVKISYAVFCLKKKKPQ